MLKIFTINFNSNSPIQEEQSSLNVKSLCICDGSVKDEMMIMCVNQCKQLFFHYSCVKLVQQPEDYQNWQCPTCRKKTLADRKQKSLRNITLELSSNFKQINYDMFLPSIMKLDLSFNNIEQIPIEVKRLVNLRIIYLHFNLLRSDTFIQYLQNMNLSYLTIFNNPVSTRLGIRSRIIHHIKTLWALDFNIVVDEEINENFLLQEKSPYRMLSSGTKLNWPLIQIKEEKKLLASEVFWLELNYINSVYQKCSFILIIQKTFRGCKTRRNLKATREKQKNEIKKIQSTIDHWKAYVNRQIQIKSILMSQTKKNFIRLIEIYRKYKIKKYKEFIEKNAGKIIFRALKKNLEMMNNFYHFLQKGNQKFYIAKNQLQIFLIILNRTLREIETNQYIRNRKIIESIIKFIQENSFSEIPEKNNTKYLRESQIVAYRYPLNFEKFNFKRIINLMLQPGKYLKLQYSFQESNNTFQQDTIIKKQFQENLFKKKKQQKNDEKSTLDYSELEKLRLQKQDFIQSPFLYIFKKQVNVKNIENKFNVPLNEEQQEKALRTFKRIEHLQQTLYFQFMEVYFPNKTLFREFIKIVYIFNREAQKDSSKDQLHIFFDFDVRKINGVLKIQKVFRSYFSFKRNNSLTLNQLIQLINRTRAVKVIQRWVRNIRFHHRQTFFKEISTLIKQINTSSLYLPCEIYESLVNINKENKNHLRFLECYSTVNFLIKNIESSEQITKTYQFDFRSKVVIIMRAKRKKQININKKYQNLTCRVNVLPLWLQQKIIDVPTRFEQINLFDENTNIDFSEIQKLYKIPTYQEVQHEQCSFDFSFQNGFQKADILHLLHTGSMLSKGTILGVKYIRFTFCSISEARYRMFALALKTYRFKNSTFIKLFPDYIWQSMRVFRKRISDYFESYYKKISNSYEGIKIQYQVPYGNRIGDQNLYLFTVKNQDFFEKKRAEDQSNNFLPLHFYTLDDQQKQIKIKENLFYIQTKNSKGLEKEENLRLNNETISLYIDQHTIETKKSRQFNSLYLAKKIQDDLINTPIQRSQQSSPIFVEEIRDESMNRKQQKLSLSNKLKNNSSKNYDQQDKKLTNSRSKSRSNQQESQNQKGKFQLNQIEEVVNEKISFKELKTFTDPQLSNTFNSVVQTDRLYQNKEEIQLDKSKQQVQQERINRYNRKQIQQQDFDLRLANFCAENKLDKEEQRMFLQMKQEEIISKNKIQKNLVLKGSEFKKMREEENEQIQNITNGCNYILKQEKKFINEQMKKLYFIHHKLQVSEQYLSENTQKNKTSKKEKEVKQDIAKRNQNQSEQPKSQNLSQNQSQIVKIPHIGNDSTIQQNSSIISNIQDKSTQGYSTYRKNLPPIELSTTLNAQTEQQYTKDRRQLSLKYRHSVFPEELFPLIMQRKQGGN